MNSVLLTAWISRSSGGAAPPSSKVRERDESRRDRSGRGGFLNGHACESEARSPHLRSPRLAGFSQGHRDELAQPARRNGLGNRHFQVIPGRHGGAAVVCRASTLVEGWRTACRGNRTVLPFAYRMQEEAPSVEEG
jgi:hypothetical protein